ncbi:phosphatase PAP2 family protein [Paracoccus shanxieyensis]|uniref:Phosphatase PAP2 family protein n=1 Tax=Paracoccus shanxieyensis TaxID=2675752 RepID=A0A6L6IW08_9RHOB|nr:phosphatase PAP2 family protein [Paracoccus shanxieyensis]MTH62774.1 phosphatase PAP2 family protein [Paracoccus shanxieyensis]MTH86142.1 phosphatase PAP2 family protein [Paracoccus shanxieyensis]
MQRLFATRGLPVTIMAVLVGLLVLTGPKAEKLGDRFQVALPLLAWGCQAVNGHGAEYALRYAVMFIGLHATKQGLGDAPINQRPNGGDAGMPSGHTATAAFGASALLQECAMTSTPVRIAVIIAAGFTGASRMDAGAHTIWQVLFGVFWGLACDRALRHHAPTRQRIRIGFKRLRRQRSQLIRKIACHIVLPRRLRWS